MAEKRGKSKSRTKGGGRMSDRETAVPTGAGYADENASATSEIKETASDAVDAAQTAVASAAETVQQTASAVVDTAQQATSAVTSAVTSKVDQVGDAAAGKVEQIADTVAHAAGSADVSEGTRQVAATTVNVLDRTAEYLRDGDIGVIVEDLRSVVRRHPLRSLVVGLGLGYLARSTFFPASSSAASSRPSSRPGGTRYTPTFQEVPVYRGEMYGSTSMGDIGVGSTTLDDTALGIGLGDASLGVDDALDMERMTVGDDAAGLGGLDIDDSLGSMGVGDIGTTSMERDLAGVDTLGLGADETSAYMGGTAVDMPDVSDTDDALGDMTGTSDMGSVGIGGDNELLGGDAMMGADTLDTTESDTSAASADTMGTSGDDAARSANASTMPTDDLLRQWDDSTSGGQRSS
jgi:hypothetical protein